MTSHPWAVLPGDSPWAVAIWIWLNLMLFPASLGGLLYAYYAMKTDRLQLHGLTAEHCERVMRAIVVVWVLAGTLSAGIAAAAVYNNCNDPAYINTWWWYAWGCWMY